MIRKQDMAGMIQMFEEKLKRYEEGLRLNPESIAYKALVKNTRDYLEELYEEVRTLTSQSLTTTPKLAQGL
jgi:hypothetical protein